jgi:hypothetical protein
VKFKILEGVVTSIKRVEGNIFIYKNPTLQELRAKDESKDNRGIIDAEGNLYLESFWTTEDKPYSYLIHDSLLHYLHKENLFLNIGGAAEGDWSKHSKWLKKAVFVERWGDTLNFYLSESYYIKMTENTKKDIKKIYTKAKQKNPLLNFYIKKYDDKHRENL